VTPEQEQHEGSRKNLQLGVDLSMASHFSVSASWPVAMTKLNHERWMRMNLKIIACTRFHAFAILPGKLLRWGKATLNEVRKPIDRSLLWGRPIQGFSG
jgi:hypothetical protein